MARLDQLLQVRVALRVGLEIVPGRDVQSGDPRLAPARREVIHIHPRPISGIEEGPKTIAAEGRVQAQIRQRVQQIRKTLVPALPGRSGHPKDGSGAALQPGSHRRAGPAFAGKYLRTLGNLEHRQLEPLLPHDGQRRAVHIAEALHSHRVLLRTPEAEQVGQRRLAFQNQDGAALHAGGPFDARRRTGPRHENPRHPGGLALEPDGSENLRPCARVIREHAEVRQFGGAGQAG